MRARLVESRGANIHKRDSLADFVSRDAYTRYLLKKRNVDRNNLVNTARQEIYNSTASYVYNVLSYIASRMGFTDPKYMRYDKNDRNEGLYVGTDGIKIFRFLNSSILVRAPYIKIYRIEDSKISNADVITYIKRENLRLDESVKDVFVGKDLKNVARELRGSLEAKVADVLYSVVFVDTDNVKDRVFLGLMKLAKGKYGIDLNKEIRLSQLFTLFEDDNFVELMKMCNVLRTK